MTTDKTCENGGCDFACCKDWGQLPRRSAWLAPHSTASIETVEASRSTWRLLRHGNEGIDTPAGAENH